MRSAPDSEVLLNEKNIHLSNPKWNQTGLVQEKFVKVVFTYAIFLV